MFLGIMYVSLGKILKFFLKVFTFFIVNWDQPTIISNLSFHLMNEPKLIKLGETGFLGIFQGFFITVMKWTILIYIIEWKFYVSFLQLMT